MFGEVQWVAVAATIIVFVACVIISFCCRKRQCYYKPKEKSFLINASIVGIIWILWFIFFGWSWYWLIANTTSNKKKLAFNWMFGLSLFLVLLYFISFFIVGSLAVSVIIVTGLLVLMFCITLESGFIQNWWIMTFGILAMIFFLYVLIVNALLCRKYGYQSYVPRSTDMSPRSTGAHGVEVTVEKKEVVSNTISSF